MKKCILLISTLGLLIVGCLPTPIPATMPAEVELDAEDNGCKIKLVKGQILTISLRGNPTTGYNWQVEDPLEEQVLRQIGEAEFKPQSDLMGAPGILTLRFEALDAGQTTLTLVYHRPWEKGVEPLETFLVQVVVR